MIFSRVAVFLVEGDYPSVEVGPLFLSIFSSRLRVVVFLVEVEKSARRSFEVLPRFFFDF